LDDAITFDDMSLAPLCTTEYDTSNFKVVIVRGDNACDDALPSPYGALLHTH
jgi:hypothetical protein